MMISFLHTDSYAHIFVFLRKAYINACCTFPINNSLRKKQKFFIGREASYFAKYK